MTDVFLLRVELLATDLASAIRQPVHVGMQLKNSTREHVVIFVLKQFHACQPVKGLPLEYVGGRAGVFF